MNLKIKPNTLVIVLVEPAGAINLGSVARLCANFGVDELRLVNPSCNPNDNDAQKMAVKGKNFLNRPKKFKTLLEAIEDCDRVIATCGRLDYGEIHLDPSEQALTWFCQNPTSNPIAIVFGREDRGLTNQELQLANKVITLNSSKNYPSLNLSHAVAIVLHELSKYKNIQPKSLSINSYIPSSPKQLNDFILDAQELLIEIGFLLQHTANARMTKVKSLLKRAEIRSEEIALLRGMIRQIRWAINKNKS